MVELRKEANQDLQEIHQWYETERAGLGDEFLDETMALFQRIENTPQLYGRLYGQFRGATIHRFPYVVLYREIAGDVTVHAILHTSRSKAVWRKRLK